MTASRAARAQLVGLSSASRLLPGQTAVQDSILAALQAPPPPPVTRRQRDLARAARREGERLSRAGDWGGAVKALHRATKHDPEDADLWLALGRACIDAALAADAVAALMQAIGRRPAEAEAHLLIGTAFDLMGDVTSALAAFTRAIELAPHSLDAAIRLAGALAVAGRRTEAAALLERAAGEASSVPAMLARARALALQERPEAAAETLRAAVLREPAHASAWRLLASALATCGDIAGSRDAARRAVALNPLETGAFLDLVRAETMAAADRPLLARMAAVLPDRRLTQRQRMVLHFALGKAHDDLGEPAAAMAQFDAANRLRGGMFAFDRAGLIATVDRIIATFTPALLHLHAALGAPDDRPVLIVGMPRSGTTLTEQILSSHPDVAGGGEMQFWLQPANTWPADLPPDQAAELIGGIVARNRQALDAVSPTARRVTDKNPYNFAALGMIRLAFPNARIVHCRRNPLDVCLSLYTTFISARTDFAARRADLVLFYRQYRRLMAHWRAVLPPERFLEIDYESLVTDREAETRRLLAFCGLDWHPACLAPEGNRRAIHTASLFQVRRPVQAGSVERWRRYEPWLGELRALLDDPGPPDRA